MGCVTSEGTNDKPKRSTKDLALARDSMGNHLDDVGIARRKDQKEIDNSLTKQIEDVSKKNRELNRDVEKLKKENEMKKKESEVSSQDK